jgi:hypothetical protein
MTEEVDRDARRREMERSLADAGLLAFSEVDVVPEFESGVIGAAQANGIAGLQSNTVIVGWPKKPGRLEAWLRVIRGLSRVGMSTVIARLNLVHEPGQDTRIDLWWGGLEHNGDLMLLLAYLMSRNPEWTNARVLVRSIARDEEEQELQTRALENLLQEVRIPADTDIIMRRPDQSIADIIHIHSADADAVFLGLQEPPPGTEADYSRRMEQLANGLKTTIFVRNAGEFAGKLI